MFGNAGNKIIFLSFDLQKHLKPFKSDQYLFKVLLIIGLIILHNQTHTPMTLKFSNLPGRF